GRALEASDAGVTDVPVEECVRAGTLLTENAALVGRLIGKPGALKPGEHWFEKALTTPTHELRRDVNERIEEMAQETPHLIPMTLHVTEKTRTGFARARVIASREARRGLTEGQTFALLVSRFLDSHDETRSGEKPRRVGDTAEL